MRLKGLRVGFAITGSHCTIERVLHVAEKMVFMDGAELFPVLSDTVNTIDTRFGPAQGWKEFLHKVSKNKIITTIVEAEQIGPKKLFDILVVAPCTGNTMAKLTHGIVDSPVLMAIKSHLRNLQPVVIAISTNDGLGFNAGNIGILLNTKNIYLVPFGQDSPSGKANSLVAHMEMIPNTIVEALKGKQLQPLLVSYQQ
ncbi:MAG: dipicolinate synthase subunit B [Desulfitobacteriaceae bacterium]|nr:dipicolinate synthase subunit B [Desulfitobacteriaceae bacterium]